MLRFAIACMSGTALWFLGTHGFANNAPLPHQGTWPINNWHNHQPTQDQLNALHLHDVTPDQAREIDRLYDQLLSSSARIFSQHPALEH
jgi:hypothetical protein